MRYGSQSKEEEKQQTNGRWTMNHLDLIIVTQCNIFEQKKMQQRERQILEAIDGRRKTEIRF